MHPDIDKETIDDIINEVGYNLAFEVSAEQRADLHQKMKSRLLFEIQWLQKQKVAAKMGVPLL